MSIEGRINVDALFHHKTNAGINVLSLAQSDEYTAGKVAILAGTVGESPTPLALQPTSYRDPDGNLVSFVGINRAVVKAESGELSFYRWDAELANQLETTLFEGDIAVLNLFNLDAGSEYLPTIASRSGVSGYTIIVLGS